MQANHEMVIKHFKIVGAQGEIAHLNIEIWCLQTWVNHEDSHLLSTSQALKSSTPYIAARVHELYMTRHQVNNVHRMRLQSIYALAGYSGHWTAGIQAGRMDVIPSTGLIGAHRHEMVADHEVVLDLEGNTDMEIVEDDQANDEAVRLGEFLESS